MFNLNQTDQRQSLQPSPQAPSPQAPSPFQSTSSSGTGPTSQQQGQNLDAILTNVRLCVKATNAFAGALTSLFASSSV